MQDGVVQVVASRIRGRRISFWRRTSGEAGSDLQTEAFGGGKGCKVMSCTDTTPLFREGAVNWNGGRNVGGGGATG
jgi:hypothetical protein